jgi:hypothetical protein
MSYTNNWTQIIRQLMTESHTKEELMKLSNAELKKLHDEYTDKGDEDSQKEAKAIKDILDERGDDKEEKEEDKEDMKQQNEELMLMLDVLCEMVGVDMETLVEETRKEMENLAHAYGWDQKSPEGATGANERIARVRANMKRLGKRNTRDAIPAGMKTALNIELSGDDVHERSAKQGGGVVKDRKAFDRTQRSIEKIGDKVQLVDIAKEAGMLPKPKSKLKK